MSDTPETPETPSVPPAVPPAGTGSGLPAGAPLPPPLPQAAALPRQKARTGVVVGVVVAVVVAAGAIGALLNSGSGTADADPVPITLAPTAPTAPVTPGAGTVPAPVTLPGPSVAPPVTTVPDTVTPDSSAPDSSPPDSSAPGTTEPSTDATAPDILPPTTAGAGTDDTSPSVEPPETTVTNETTVPPDQGDTGDALVFAMSEGVTFSVPNESWFALSTDTSGFATNGSSSVFFELVPGSTGATDLLASYQSTLAEVMSSPEYSDIAPFQSYSNVVVDGAQFGYSGFLGSGQTGVTPITGTVWGELRVDGLGIITDVYWPTTDDGQPPADDVEDLNMIINSLVYGG